MKNLYNREGQTLIETALVLFLLLIILLGITEFSRAWFNKNSLKNAARHGVRIAVVTDSITSASNVACGNSCPATSPPTTTTHIIEAVCCSPGVRNDSDTDVSLTFTDDDSSGGLNKGDTVTISADFSDSDFFIVGGSPWPWPKEMNTNVSASMRYE
jgi:Flp pilus assembly protein TadG